MLSPGRPCTGTRTPFPASSGDGVLPSSQSMCFLGLNLMGRMQKLISLPFLYFRIWITFTLWGYERGNKVSSIRRITGSLHIANQDGHRLTLWQWMLIHNSFSGEAQAACTLPTRMVELPCWLPPARGGATLPSSCWLLVLSLTSRFSQNRNWLFRKEAPASSLKKT